MNPVVGETLVYPHHGAVTITAITERTIKGVEKTYLTLRAHASELDIQLPVDSLELVGVRNVIDTAGVQAVYAVLQSDDVEEAANWSRRFKSNEGKMATGDVHQISEVVRDLWRRDVEKGVSPGEKRMLQRARGILISELALALGRDVAAAEVELDEVLRAGMIVPAS